METLLTGEHLTEFMRQYLMLGGDEVSKSAIYSVLKKRLLSVPDSAITDELHRMQQASVLYADIVGVTSSTESSIAEGLARLRRWEVATANTFLLKLLEAYSREKVSTIEVADCLAIIESFVVRRTVCAVPTNQLKRIFLSLAKAMPESNVPEWLCETLASGGSGRRWPKDEELKDEIMRYRAYSQPYDRCKFLLESIEDHFGHKEPAAFGSATIEHIMPRTLTDDWRQELGESCEEIHERWIDLLGNLTLTAYNSELSNYSFTKKRQMLCESHFEINKWIAARELWSEDALKDRSLFLLGKIVDIWARPQ
jgi:hypothetical protein